MFETELLTADEAAQRLRITARTLLRWARANRIESVRVSKKKILFTEQAIEIFIQARTRDIESGPSKDRAARNRTARNRKREVVTALQGKCGKAFARRSIHGRKKDRRTV